MGEKRQTGKLMGNDPVFGVYVLTLLVERFTVVEDIQWIERGARKEEIGSSLPHLKDVSFTVSTIPVLVTGSKEKNGMPVKGGCEKHGWEPNLKFARRF